MYKEVFENKKVAIFDIETVIANPEDLYFNAISKVLTDLEITWIDPMEHLVNGKTMEETWKSILEDPLIDTKILLDQVLNVTNSKLVEYLNEVDTVDTKDGFWPFIDELREDFKFKLIIKSEFNEIITKKLMSLAELENVFDASINQTQGKRQDLYNSIIKTLGDMKIKALECVSFERNKTPARESTLKNILTICIKGDSAIRDYYPYKITIFLQDFTTFVGNINKTYRESFFESHENIKKLLDVLTKSKK